MGVGRGKGDYRMDMCCNGVNGCDTFLFVCDVLLFGLDLFDNGFIGLN